MRRSVLADQAEREAHQRSRVEAGRQIIGLPTVPNGLDEIRDIYGWPVNESGKADEAFYSSRIKRFDLPFSMRLSWNKATSVRRSVAHELVIDSLVDALTEIRDYKGAQYLEENNLDLFGGIYAFRFKRGQEVPSTHAWGIAIDINPDLGRMGEKPRMPSFIVDAFKSRGWIWGGDWSHPDGMHFQACSGY